LAGDLDALLILATDPYDPITVAMRGGSQLVPIQGVAVERLGESSPFVNLSSIPDQTYPGQTERVHTISIDTMLLCRSDLDEGIVYEITREFFKALPSFVQTEDSLRSVVLSRIDATPIPLHPGAQRYYRERELSR
jgi:TRAP transporter TAXI family solute receptor